MIFSQKYVNFFVIFHEKRTKERKIDSSAAKEVKGRQLKATLIGTESYRFKIDIPKKHSFRKQFALRKK